LISDHLELIESSVVFGTKADNFDGKGFERFLKVKKKGKEQITTSNLKKKRLRGNKNN
jgi:hypothetical protein